MSLQSRLSDLITAIGADVKALKLAKLTTGTNANRTVFSHTVPGSSPFEYTVPLNQVIQIAPTGGSGVAALVRPSAGDAFATYVGGTATPILAVSGETVRFTWTTTAPTAIRSRILWTIG